MMDKKRILILPGDEIGPEITTEVIKIIDFLNESKITNLLYEFADIGGASLDKYNKPITDEALDQATKSDAVLLACVGTPKYDDNPRELKPEHGLLALRKHLNLFINIRPIFVFNTLSKFSSLKHELINDLDIIIIRELIGDVYFGEPRGFKDMNGNRVGYNTMLYSESEVKRITQFAIDTAKKRTRQITSIDKANVLECSQLWRQTVDRMLKDYDDIQLQHMYVDNAAMQIIKNPRQFDVILTPNLFGDILSDAASMLTGSIGLLPSASLSDSIGMFEPIHGSAPDISGQGISNPLAMILSLGMMFEYSLQRQDLAKIIRESVDDVLKSGYFTKDLSTDDFVSTSEMGDKVLERIKKAC
ncbi:MAG: 3-isopropylmalate dehydrogenase [Pseudomonadota bacterium]|nr:3-isopropylmalate dehydrogenase [Pseudomonadota bacterium]